MQLTTTRLHLPGPRAWWNLPTPVAAAVITFALIAIVALVGRIRSEPPAVVAFPTPALPIVVIQKEAAPAPAQQVIYQQPPLRWVTAFAAPGGDVLGPIPEPLMSAITGRWGDSWLSTSHEGATVWVRASELGANLANLAPVPQLQPVVVYQQPAYAPEPVYQTDNSQAPEPPPTPEPQAQPAIVGQPVQVPPAAQQDNFPQINPAFPTFEARPGVPDEVTFISIQEQWKMEHCVIIDDPTTCH